MGAQEADGRPDEGCTTLRPGDHGDESGGMEKTKAVETILVTQQGRKEEGFRPLS